MSRQEVSEQAFYDRQYARHGRYDHQREAESQQAENPAEAAFWQRVAEAGSDQALLVDLGCGDGWFTSKLTACYGEVFGIEPSDLIRAALALPAVPGSEQYGEKSGDKSGQKLRFLRQDACQMTLEDNSVDVVISRRGPDPEQEVLRILKPGGVFIFITIGEQDAAALKQLLGRGQLFGAEQRVAERLTEKFSAAGFSAVTTQEFRYDEHYDSSDALKALLHRVPIFGDFSARDYPQLEAYCAAHHAAEGVVLGRHRVLLRAYKPATV